MSKNIMQIVICLFITAAGFICGYYIYKPDVDKSKNYLHPYKDYSWVSTCGDTVLYKKIVAERMERTPSHPDYLDLSIKMAGVFGYTPAYYNAYMAIDNLYKYNNLRMGDKVKRLMYSYLQLAIENNDNHVTKEDLKRNYNEYPKGLSIENDK